MDELSHDAHLIDITWEFAHKVLGWRIAFNGKWKTLYHGDIQAGPWVDTSYPDGYLVSQAIEYGMLPHYAKQFGEETCKRFIEHQEQS